MNEGRFTRIIYREEEDGVRERSRRGQGSDELYLRPNVFSVEKKEHFFFPFFFVKKKEKNSNPSVSAMF